MKKRRIMILILLMIIGFASVTTTLVLNGKVGIGVELDDFDVIFIESLLDGKEDTKATISEDKKTITFATDKFINKGESARLDYKVKNTSTQYNADVEINCTNEANEYVNVTSSFDGNQIPLANPINIKAQEVKSGYINAELIKAYAGEDTSIEIKCTINVTATSREDYAYSLNFNSNGGNNIDDKSVVLNEEYGALEEPVREGYTFLGWYDEEDNKVSSSTILDSKGNRNLYAKWKYICPLEVGKEWTFDYTGEEQDFIVPCDGEYKIELWGAGGKTNSASFPAGKGAYTNGKIYLNSEKMLYFFIGGANGYNAIANFSSYPGAGGGATDLRLYNVDGVWNDFGSLKSRIMVAAGGGGAQDTRINSWRYTGIGGDAGGLTGFNGRSGSSNTCGTGYVVGGGTQTGVNTTTGSHRSGSFGVAGVFDYTGGGGGYYGGSGMNCSYGGGGGSSFISGHSGCNAIAESSTSSKIVHTGQPNHYSGYVFKDTKMIDGAGYKWTNVKGSYTGMPSHDGKSTMTGNSGNGYAKITLVSID